MKWAPWTWQRAVQSTTRFLRSKCPPGHTSFFFSRTVGCIPYNDTCTPEHRKHKKWITDYQYCGKCWCVSSPLLYLLILCWPQNIEYRLATTYKHLDHSVTDVLWKYLSLRTSSNKLNELLFFLTAFKHLFSFLFKRPSLSSSGETAKYLGGWTQKAGPFCNHLKMCLNNASMWWLCCCFYIPKLEPRPTAFSSSL